MLVDVKNEIYTENVEDFIKKQEAEGWFEKKYGISISERNILSYSDEDIIRDYFSEREGKFLVFHVELIDAIFVFELVDNDEEKNEVDGIS